MAQENVVVVRFTEPSKAYQALSVLKELDGSGRIGLESAAVVERTATGELRTPESADNGGLVGTASGSLIGMLIGVLGGPVGVLLGRGTGALMGGAFDVDRALTSEQALTVLGKAIPTGSTAVIASVEEPRARPGVLVSYPRRVVSLQNGQRCDESACGYVPPIGS
jgi:uncharacterized membrane protein